MEGYIEIEKYAALEAESKAKISALTQQLAAFEFQLEQLKRLVFGAKSERYIPDSAAEQLLLFGDGPVAAQAEEKVVVPQHERQKNKPKKKPVRLVLPEHLKRVEQVIEPPGLDLTQLVRIGEERTESLHYSPAELTVKVIVRPKYALKTATEPEASDRPIAIAPLPSRFIDKCIADESLLGVILTDKYLDHLPLYRIAARFERLGMVIPRSTLCGWVAQAADRIVVLHNKLIELVLTAGYLQVDETRMEVLPGKGKTGARGKPKKRKTHRGYQWGYHAVLEKLIFFDYSPTRKAENPREHLKHFDGVLQTDCYDVYDQIRKLYPELTHYHCLGHARREFEKALGNDAQRAGHALQQFQLLYALERRAREEQLDVQAIYELRQKKARPVLEDLFTWMEDESPKLPPSSPVAKAMGYMLQRKARMMHYLMDGRLLIDTNPIENLIRPIAVGRRNYLFAGSHEGAQRAAIFYSLFACCKLNGVNPVEWLDDILLRLPEHPINRIEELLPHLWKNAETEVEILASI
jgi:transposase